MVDERGEGGWEKTLVQYFATDVLTLIQEFCELVMEAHKILLLTKRTKHSMATAVEGTPVHLCR
eukprot:275935-Ditylum_brightwellii.AAC.1